MEPDNRAGVLPEARASMWRSRWAERFFEVIPHSLPGATSALALRVGVYVLAVIGAFWLIAKLVRLLVLGGVLFALGAVAFHLLAA